MKTILITLITLALSGCAVYPVGYNAGIPVFVAPAPVVWGPPVVVAPAPCVSRIVPIFDAWGNVVGRRFVC